MCTTHFKYPLPLLGLSAHRQPANGLTLVVIFAVQRLQRLENPDGAKQLRPVLETSDLTRSLLYLKNELGATWNVLRTGFWGSVGCARTVTARRSLSACLIARQLFSPCSVSKNPRVTMTRQGQPKYNILRTTAYYYLLMRASNLYIRMCVCVRLCDLASPKYMTVPGYITRRHVRSRGDGQRPTAAEEAAAVAAATTWWRPPSGRRGRWRPPGGPATGTCWCCRSWCRSCETCRQGWLFKDCFSRHSICSLYIKLLRYFSEQLIYDIGSITAVHCTVFWKLK